MNSWIKEAIIYEIFPRVFSDEGNFQGIINRLSELKDLGVNTLWLMPVQKIGKVNRKGTLGSPYAIADHYFINSDLGDENSFRRLVETSHKNNFRLILDWVAMYTAWDHPWIKQHPDWYRKNEQGEIISVPNTDWYDIAHLNYGNPELHEAMIHSMSYWLKKFDIDGFRCDTAGNMYGLKPIIFWQKAIAQLKKIKPEILMLAEWEDAEFHKNAFDLTYSWKLYHLLRKMKENEKNLQGLTSVESVQITPQISSRHLSADYSQIKGTGFIHELLELQKQEFCEGALRLRIIENHDEQRAMATFGKDAVRAYATLIFTLDGVPLLYNGQEIGETERPSHFEPFKINWQSGDKKLRDFYKKLIKIRCENPVLYSGCAKKIQTDRDEYIYAFSKEYREHLAVIVINFSPGPVTANLKLPMDGKWQDLLSNGIVKLSSRQLIADYLTPYASHIFVKK